MRGGGGRTDEQKCKVRGGERRTLTVETEREEYSKTCEANIAHCWAERGRLNQRCSVHRIYKSIKASWGRHFLV